MKLFNFSNTRIQDKINIVQFIRICISIPWDSFVFLNDASYLIFPSFFNIFCIFLFSDHFQYIVVCCLYNNILYIYFVLNLVVFIFLGLLLFMLSRIYIYCNLVTSGAPDACLCMILLVYLVISMWEQIFILILFVSFLSKKKKLLGLLLNNLKLVIRYKWN